jgi:mono/diheme cytochrome c family protein
MVAVFVIALGAASAPAARAYAKTTSLVTPARYAAGKTLFKTLGCGSCHTLKPAGTTGTLGPNLDQFEPPYSLIITRITNGTGVMPAFEHRISKVQIGEIAAFVYRWTSRP